MNSAQTLWWRQALSDRAMFELLRHQGAPQCHLLHYLQMATEKLSKAYFWRSGNPPPKTHTGFVQFLRALLSRRQTELDRIAAALGFKRAADLESWVVSVQTLAYGLQGLAPKSAGDAPNPEYPWPHEQPAHCPATHSFAIWHELTHTSKGRHLLLVIERAIRHFDEFA